MFKQRHKGEIEARAAELWGEVHDKVADLWVNDQAALLELRQWLIEDSLQRREAPDLAPRDVSRFTRDLDQLVYRAAELAGLIRQRAQVEVDHSGIATYEMPGLDMHRRSWMVGLVVAANLSLFRSLKLRSSRHRVSVPGMVSGFASGWMTDGLALGVASVRV